MALLACGCARRDAPIERHAEAEAGREVLAIPLEALADSGSSVPLPVTRPPAAWIVHVRPATAAELDVPPPVPLPDVPPDTIAPPHLDVDPSLRPPIPRRPASIRLPSGRHRAASVELEVRVDESGRVTDAIWAGGSADTALVSAAVECARSMAFFPAHRAGVPVAVWCRQRFDFGR
jgi:TonB family protein